MQLFITLKELSFLAFSLYSTVLGIGYCFGMAEYFDQRDFESTMNALRTNFYLEWSKLVIDAMKIYMWIKLMLEKKRFSWKISCRVPDDIKKTDDQPQEMVLTETIFQVFGHLIVKMMDFIHMTLLFLYIKYLPQSLLNYPIANYMSKLPDFKGNPLAWIPLVILCYPAAIRYGYHYLRYGNIPLFNVAA